MVNAMMIHRKDDVAVVIEDIKKGEMCIRDRTICPQARQFGARSVN